MHLYANSKVSFIEKKNMDILLLQLKKNSDRYYEGWRDVTSKGLVNQFYLSDSQGQGQGQYLLTSRTVWPGHVRSE